MVTHQQLESAKGAVELSGGLLYLRWTTGAFVVEGDARAVTAMASVLCSDQPRPMLVVMNRMEGVEHKARNVFAQAWPLTRIAVGGASAVDRVIVDFYVARPSHLPHEILHHHRRRDGLAGSRDRRSGDGTGFWWKKVALCRRRARRRRGTAATRTPC